jgi:reverse gyrase
MTQYCYKCKSFLEPVFVEIAPREWVGNMLISAEYRATCPICGDETSDDRSEECAECGGKFPDGALKKGLCDDCSRLANIDESIETINKLNRRLK